MRLRLLRKQSGMTLRTLAERADLTESYLSKLERGQSVPSIAVAIRLAEALGVDVAILFGDEAPTELITVVRREERVALAQDQVAGHSVYEGIASAVPGKQMLPFMLYPSPSATRRAFREHPGEELLFIHSGSVQLEFPNFEVTLDIGDTAYFNGGLPHRTRSVSQEQASALIVISNGGTGDGVLAH